MKMTFDPISPMKRKLSLLWLFAMDRSRICMMANRVLFAAASPSSLTSPRKR